MPSHMQARWTYIPLAFIELWRFGKSRCVVDWCSGVSWKKNETSSPSTWNLIYQPHALEKYFNFVNLSFFIPKTMVIVLQLRYPPLTSVENNFLFTTYPKFLFFLKSFPVPIKVQADFNNPSLLPHLHFVHTYFAVLDFVSFHQKGICRSFYKTRMVLFHIFIPGT